MRLSGLGAEPGADAGSFDLIVAF